MGEINAMVVAYDSKEKNCGFIEIYDLGNENKVFNLVKTIKMETIF
jgi:hypothetical protein